MKNAEILLDRKASVLARMGLVTRVDSHFRVSNPSGLNGRQLFYQVDRADDGTTRCSCGGSSAFRCEHIRAVRFAMNEKNTEPSARKSSPDDRTITESGRLESGEQKPNSVSIAFDHKQSKVKTTRMLRLMNSKGKKNMKQTMIEEQQLSLIPEADNVLDFTSTLKELRKHLDPNLVRQREGWRGRDGKIKMVDYIEWHTVADILDETAPNWEHRIKEIRKFDDIVTVTVAITIDGVTREGIGTGSAGTEKGIKKAEHDALKRAAVKFGIARDLYKKEFDAIDHAETESNEKTSQFPVEPVAMSIADLVTTKQLSMIRALAREKMVDADAECYSLMACKPAELSKRAASALIDHLQKLEVTEAASVKRAS